MSSLQGTITELCYVTHDLERAIKGWAEGPKAGPFFVHTLPADMPERTYRGAPAKDGFMSAVGLCGDTAIELVQPTNDEPSVFQEVLQTKGDMAFHHICPSMRALSAAEFDAAYKGYLDLGYVPANEMEVPFIGRYCLFDAREQLGSFVELAELSPELFAGLETMRAAHLNWDGSRPQRDATEYLS
jgi:hypothetical protein